MLKVVAVPQGKPFGSGLLVRKSASLGASKAPSGDLPFLAFLGSVATIEVITPSMFETSPMSPNEETCPQAAKISMARSVGHSYPPVRYTKSDTRGSSGVREPDTEMLVFVE